MRLRFQLVAAAAICAATFTSSYTATAQQRATDNRGVVELEASSAEGISVRIAQDLARLVDNGATRRLVPVVGKGSLQTLLDLRYLRGVDMAILQTDVFSYAKEQKVLPDADSLFTYITKLYNEEFHLLAGPGITDISALANRKVNFDLPGSGTAITATRVFNLFKIPVAVVNDDQEVALEKLRRGEIAALAFVAAKPAPLFARLRGDEQLHFLSVPINTGAADVYVPARLTAEDYPNLLLSNRSVETLAVGNVLAVAELRQLRERDHNVANFVDVFFTELQSLLKPGHHPKWKEVNISAELEGWRRYGPANQWLQRNMQIAKKPAADTLKTMFSRFVDERRQAMGGDAMSQQDKDALFQQFEAWQRSQSE